MNDTSFDVQGQIAQLQQYRKSQNGLQHGRVQAFIRILERDRTPPAQEQGRTRAGVFEVGRIVHGGVGGRHRCLALLRLL